VESPSEKFKKE
jgi:hypothetical protein